MAAQCWSRSPQLKYPFGDTRHSTCTGVLFYVLHNSPENVKASQPPQVQKLSCLSSNWHPEQCLSVTISKLRAEDTLLIEDEMLLTWESWQLHTVVPSVLQQT